MTDTKTIRRNTKLGKRILTAPVRVCAYSLSNEFSGAEVEIERFASRRENRPRKSLDRRTEPS